MQIVSERSEHLAVAPYRATMENDGVNAASRRWHQSDAECSVLEAFQLVQSGWGQPGLPGWGSVVDDTEVKCPIDLEELIFPPTPPFGGK